MFSEKLRQLRLEKGVSQKELARVLSLTDMSISRYEHGIAEPSIDTIIKIAAYFNVSIDYLLGLNTAMTDFYDIAYKNYMSSTDNQIMALLRQLSEADTKKVFDYVVDLAIQKYKGHSIVDEAAEREKRINGNDTETQ